MNILKYLVHAFLSIIIPFLLLIIFDFSILDTYNFSYFLKFFYLFAGYLGLFFYFVPEGTLLFYVLSVLLRLIIIIGFTYLSVKDTSLKWPYYAHFTLIIGLALTGLFTLQVAYL